ncbi:MAG: hypothetical protein ACI89X_003400 [Planctomycetota bacterium]|jgi:hypothetical protein
MIVSQFRTATYEFRVVLPKDSRRQMHCPMTLVSWAYPAMNPMAGTVGGGRCDASLDQPIRHALCRIAIVHGCWPVHAILA